MYEVRTNFIDDTSAASKPLPDAKPLVRGFKSAWIIINSSGGEVHSLWREETTFSPEPDGIRLGAPGRARVKAGEAAAQRLP